MKLPGAAHPIRASYPARIGLSVVVTAIYAVLSVVLYPGTTQEPTIFAIIPAGLAAWLLGLWGGAAAGAVAFLLNAAVLYLGGKHTLAGILGGPGTAEAVVALVSGLAIGRLRDMQIKARQQAAAILHAQQETADQRALSDALRDTLSEMVGTLNLDRVLHLILNNVWRVVPHDGANIMLIDGDHARIAAWRGYTHPDVMLALAIQFDFRSLANLRQMLESGRGLAIDDVHDDPDWVHYEHGMWVHAYVGAPIRMAGRVIGFVNLDSALPGSFSDADIQRLQLFADEAAIAIHNARLYDQVARHAGRLEQRVAERTAELRAATDRLEELDRLESKFVADVSHELRTPVANLGLYVDLLENGPRAKRGEYLAVVGQQVGRLSALVESILNLTRLELGRGRSDYGPVDLNRVVRETITGFEPRAEAAGLKLVFKPDDRLTPVRGDPRQLGQVIDNLLSNAIQHTPTGEVRLSTALGAGSSEAALTVADTGTGIGADDLPHLFERFYRGQHAAKSAIPGTGLGLSIVQEIVDLHSGRISVESAAGKGSTFTVRLPLDQEGR